MTLRTTLELTTGYILKQYERHLASDKHDQALVVAIQGPQGSGKSYLASLLEHSPKLEHLKIANLSLDDLYLPHDQLVRLAESNPNNSLLSGRGQAGTHDLELGINVLRALKESNNNTRVDLPRFDKSLFQGQGDRVPKEQFRTIKGKVDLVLFEGWMNGFQPISPSSELDAILNLEHSDQRRQALGIRPQEELFLEQYSHEVLERLNRDLEPYCELWNLVDAWVELKPEQLGYVWEWRLEQEHSMKAKNGGIGMTDEQVKTFISRYMPGYELFSTGSRTARRAWRRQQQQEQREHDDRNLLTIEIGKLRQVVNVDETP